MSEKVIGRCSLCGGDVVVPLAYMSVIPPKPTCKSCGAVAANAGPVIPMESPHNHRPLWDDGRWSRCSHTTTDGAGVLTR